MDIPLYGLRRFLLAFSLVFLTGQEISANTVVSEVREITSMILDRTGTLTNISVGFFVDGRYFYHNFVDETSSLGEINFLNLITFESLKNGALDERTERSTVEKLANLFGYFGSAQAINSYFRFFKVSPCFSQAIWCLSGSHLDTDASYFSYLTDTELRDFPNSTCLYGGYELDYYKGDRYGVNGNLIHTGDTYHQYYKCGRSLALAEIPFDQYNSWLRNILANSTEANFRNVFHVKCISIGAEQTCRSPGFEYWYESLMWERHDGKQFVDLSFLCVETTINENLTGDAKYSHDIDLCGPETAISSSRQIEKPPQHASTLNAVNPLDFNFKPLDRHYESSWHNTGSNDAGTSEGEVTSVPDDAGSSGDSGDDGSGAGNDGDSGASSNDSDENISENPFSGGGSTGIGQINFSPLTSYFDRLFAFSGNSSDTVVTTEKPLNFTQGSRWLPSNCPQPYRLDLGFTSKDVNFDTACDIAVHISTFVIIGSLLLSASIVLGRRT